MSDYINIIVGFVIVLVALPLFILWLRDDIRRSRAMSHSRAQTAGKVAAYIIGFSFVILGVLDFGTNPQEKENSANPIANDVIRVMFIIFGILTWAATRFRYGGGFWSIIGAFLIGGAFAGTVSIVETHLRGWRYDSPIAFYIRIAMCWVVGSVFLFIGHRRHCKKKRVLPNL